MGWFRRIKPRVRSWHWITRTTVLGEPVARCGYEAFLGDWELSEDLPASGRSCESCLRLKLRDETAK